MRVGRAHSPDRRICPRGVLSLILVLVWVSVCFLVFRVGPPPHWRLTESSSVQSSCPPCDCYCSSAEYFFDPLGLVNSTITDCGKQDPVMNEELNKDLLTMLSEELNLQKIVANETLDHTKRSAMDVRKTFSHYQREAEKCNAGIGTCEAARERVEADLREERRLSALWEKRAREYGWKDRRRSRLRL